MKNLILCNSLFNNLAWNMVAQSLCNACGIRQRKARKAMAVAAATATTTTEKSKDAVLGAKRSSDPLKIKLQHKAKRSNNGHVSQYKKRSKLAATPKSHGRKKVCFEDFLISLSKNLAIQQVFPQDEKEAAILLMALSCGLVHGWALFFCLSFLGFFFSSTRACVCESWG